jgi:hypothetical protein
VEKATYVTVSIREHPCIFLHLFDDFDDAGTTTDWAYAGSIVRIFAQIIWCERLADILRSVRFLRGIVTLRIASHGSPIEILRKGDILERDA